MEKIEFETFRKLGNYEISNLTKKNISSTNGRVDIVKYKITVEEIEEPIEIYQQRLQELWDKCDNYHHWIPLQNKAKFYNYELIGNVGNAIKKN